MASRGQGWRIVYCCTPTTLPPVQRQPGVGSPCGQGRLEIHGFCLRSSTTFTSHSPSPAAGTGGQQTASKAQARGPNLSLLRDVNLAMLFGSPALSLCSRRMESLHSRSAELFGASWIKERKPGLKQFKTFWRTPCHRAVVHRTLQGQPGGCWRGGSG